MHLSPAPVQARLGWIAVFAALGFLAAATPCWLHGFPGAGSWSWLGALAAAGAGAAAHRPDANHGRVYHLGCIAAVGAAISLDFVFAPPLAILASCGARSDLFTAHLRWFPTTSLAMLALACCHHAPRTARSWMNAVFGFMLMLATMSLMVRGFEILAPVAGWSWGPNGMTGAMVAGMALFSRAMPLRRAGSSCDGAAGAAQPRVESSC
jgi:hypothetical protein